MTHALNAQLTGVMSTAVKESMHNPQWFMDNILKCDYDEWLLELLNAIADIDRAKAGLPTICNHEGKTRFTIRSCHGVGKTTGMAILMHWFQFTRKARIPCTAPKERTLVTRLWPAFRGVLVKSIPGYKALIRVRTKSIEWANNPDWAAIIEAANQPENLAGYHPTVDIPELMFVMEEASGVPDTMIPVIEGALSTEGAILVMISNPTKTSGEFYRSHKKAGVKELYYQMHIHPSRSKFVDTRWMESMKNKYGESSPVYLVRCMGEFADTAPNQLVPLDWIDTAIQPMPEGDGSHPTLRVSVDVADGGDDESVVTVALLFYSMTVVICQRRFSFPTSIAPIKTAEKAMDMFSAFGGDKDRDDFVVDSLGVGAGTAGYIMKAGYSVIAYKGGAASDDSHQWLNRRTQSYMVLRNQLREGKMILCEDMYEDGSDWEDLRGQLTSIKTKPGTERVEELVTKKEMQSQGIKSPDMADGLAMLCATQKPALVEWDDGDCGFSPMIIGSGGNHEPW